MKKRYITAITTLVLLSTLLLYSLIWLPATIDHLILSRVWLDPSKVQQWGQNPGTSNTVTIRNYTFFNFTNPKEHYLLGHTPIFAEIKGYSLQEMTNFTNLNYSEDMDTMNCSIWLHFGQLNFSRNLTQKVQVLNITPLGFWNQLESTSIVSFAIQAYGGIYY